ncbi:unnamed protein product [Tetraodon nigroviridis]|uniref:(spotted green pufferfish) hypothetical protein n=1 Tax=Tetraodon nigroviridis TaxID=99883 RepID=Q4SBM2_TETNG|nr:unnamed protein product [Tetraodon nigroviridis]
MATANNPRKFSEKIALHNQKQAEETAAFEEVMKDLSITRAARLQLQKSQYLQLGPSRGLYYGGSLPNVNQIGNATVEVTFQVRWQDSNRSTRHHGLVDRVYRDRNRITSPHRKPFFVDKHGRQISFCPYGSVYLSPPPDTSWRRTNSDSALHQSTLTPAQQVLSLEDRRSCSQNEFFCSLYPEQGRSSRKKMEMSRNKAGSSKSIFPSPDQQLTASLKPAAHNTGGSLPDLTNIQFPPPLPTPLDSDDAVAAAAASFGPSGATQAVSLTQGNAAVSCLLTSVMGFFCFPPIVVRGNSNELAESHLCCQLLLTLECLCETVFVFWVGVSTSQPAVTMEMQPEQDSMVPLILNAGESQSLHLPPTLPPSVSLRLTDLLLFSPPQAAISAMNLEQQLSQYAFFNQQPSNQNQQTALVQASASVNSCPVPDNQTSSQTNMAVDMNVAACLHQYRSRVGSSANQSPTSPVSSQGFSPGGSPQHNSILGSVFADFYDQQLPSIQASALSQQTSTLNYSQALMMGLTGGHRGLPDQQQQSYSNHGNIPNIILTVSGESPPSLPKDLTDSLSTDVSFDIDSQFPLDDLKIDHR